VSALSYISRKIDPDPDAKMLDISWALLPPDEETIFKVMSDDV